MQSTELPFSHVEHRQDPALVNGRRALAAMRAFLAGIGDDVIVLHLVYHHDRALFDVALGFNEHDSLRGVRTVVPVDLEPAMAVRGAAALCEKVRRCGYVLSSEGEAEAVA